MAQRFHDPVTREYVPGGWRFTCQQCGAQVSVPVALVAQWERERRLDDEIEPRLTRSLLLRAHLSRPIVESTQEAQKQTDAQREAIARLNARLDELEWRHHEQSLLESGGEP